MSLDISKEKDSPEVKVEAPKEEKITIAPDSTSEFSKSKASVAKKDDKIVEVKKSEMDALMSRLKRLEETGNKGRLTNYDNMNNEAPALVYKLRVIDGRVITSWSDLITNKAEFDPVTRKTTEDQTLEVFYEDNTSEKMSLVKFNRRYTYIYTTVVEERKLSDKEKMAKYGDRIFLLKTNEGKEYEIGQKYVN